VGAEDAEDAQAGAVPGLRLVGHLAAEGSQVSGEARVACVESVISLVIADQLAAESPIQESVEARQDVFEGVFRWLVDRAVEAERRC
jgi:hypothetical protein